MNADQLLRLLDEVPAFLTVIEGPELRITFLNRRVREAMPGLMGRSARELYTPDNPILAAVERVYATGESETISQMPPYFPDGAYADRVFTRTLVALRDENGQVNGILTLGQEVTGEAAARYAAQDAERRSRAELQNLFDLLEEAPALITVLEGRELRVGMVNRATRTLFGGRDLVGRALGELLSPENATLVAARRVFETGKTETLDLVAREVESFIGRSFSTTLVAIRNSAGQITRVMTVSFDTTEQKRASRAKDDFLAMLGHELRNPLAPMVTTLEVMRLRGAASPEIELLERQVRHLTRLVDDLLDVSRIARGKVELKRRDVELSAIVHRALEMTGPLIETRQHRVVSDLTPVWVHGDPDRLAQVVANLITNAAKYSEPGERIRLHLERAGQQARLTVADDGVGIAPEMIGSVFEAFVQQPQTLERSRGGLGLGLSIVKSFVEAHGGTVSAHSDGVGRGSRFVIELPMIDAGSAGAQAAPRVVAPIAQAAALRILIVDDIPDVAAALAEILTVLGHTVAIAHDGPTALAKAATFKPQLGLLDIGLPVMDGYELAAALRAAHDLRLVAMTGYGQERDRERSREAGFDAHLVKPVEIEQLVQVLSETAAHARAPAKQSSP
jgi:signal transduction histidine kinase/ActR/RegA family two-component response regulator